MSKIDERIHNLQKIMFKNKMQAYIICTNDFHGSEYVGEYFKEREFMSGFTGSAGNLLVLKDRAYLWTDGRYFIQAEQQLEDTDIELMKMGQNDVPTIGAFLREYMVKEYFDKSILNKEGRIGFDGRTITLDFVERLDKELEGLEISYVYDKDYVDNIWSDRPALSAENVWELDIRYTGKSRKDKLCDIQEKIAECADFMVISALDEIAWLLNLRGNDVKCNPVFLSYMLIGREYIGLYVNENIISDKIRRDLENDGITIKPYNDIYEDLRMIPFDNKIWVDNSSANYMIKMSISASEREFANARGLNNTQDFKHSNIISRQSPVIISKAVKNDTEIDNIRMAHIKDGVAVTKFMYWLKQNIGKLEISEISAADKLEELRKEQENYIGESFEPIMAYGEHGAIVHYSATEESNVVLEPKGFLLSDTGGHYLEGTTDITRTYALGELTDEEKKGFTLALIANLNLAAAKFLHGTRGANLDYIARKPLWDYGMDYRHGTGHGVGYLLNVHEGPNSFRWKIDSNEVNSAIIEEGMVTSNEPGVYIAGEYGVRHENLIVCKKIEENEYGTFLGFEELTMVPFDIDGIDMKYMSDKDVKLLNMYHKKVYENIAPYLTEDERVWLGEVMREV